MPRMKEWESIKEQLEQIHEDIKDIGYQIRYLKRLERLMEKCTAENSYAAIKATNILNDETYLELKTYFQKLGVWNHTFTKLESDLEKIALELVK